MWVVVFSLAASGFYLGYLSFRVALSPATFLCTAELGCFDAVIALFALTCGLAAIVSHWRIG